MTNTAISDQLELVNTRATAILEMEQTEELCLAAVTKSPSLLNKIHPQFKTPAVCLAAVSVSGLALRYVPFKEKKYVICHTAVKNNPAAIAFVPSGMRSAMPIHDNPNYVNHEDKLSEESVAAIKVKLVEVRLRMAAISKVVTELEEVLSGFM